MKRYLQDQVRKDLLKKMVFLCGPRQAGKTTLAKSVLKDEKFSKNHLSWDDDVDRETIIKRLLPSSGIIVLDEIHKYVRWRQYLKGLFDKRRDEIQILVTGSAKLDHYRRGGDSLQGRYNLLRLHPLSYAEVKSSKGSLEDLMRYGNFPEPFFARSDTETLRWSRQYRSRVLREDLVALENVEELSLLERMAIALPDKVGSPLSLNSLREDLGVAHHTVARWMTMLENLFHVFRIYPFGAPTLRALKKEPKLYLFDHTLIEDRGPRFENLVATQLLKWCHYQEDVLGLDTELRYFRDVDKREVDFVLVQKRKPIMFVEAKVSDRKVSPSLQYLRRAYPQVPAHQVLLDGDLDLKTNDDIRICNASALLQNLV